MVFQNYALFPNMSVGDNVAFGLSVRGIARQEIRMRVGQTLELVKLGNLTDRRPHQLSGGQRQRVALARAIVTKPRVLLLDEPLGALDKALRVGMQIELKRIQREVGITTVFVTHDQEEALTLSDRIGILRDGEVVQEGAPGDIYDKPRTEFAATFLGDANILSGTVKGAAIVLADGTPIRCGGPLPAAGSESEMCGPARADHPSTNEGESGANRRQPADGSRRAPHLRGQQFNLSRRLAGANLKVFAQNAGSGLFPEGSQVTACWPVSSTVMLQS